MRRGGARNDRPSSTGGDVVRVLIVDDSLTARTALRQAFQAEGGVEVVGEATSGDTVVDQVRRLRPDLVTMDVFLKGRDGLDVSAAIMEECATPIVVVTAANPQHPELVYRALQAGVLEICAKLPGPSAPNHAAQRAEFVRRVRTLARVPVVHRRKSVSHAPRAPSFTGSGGPGWELTTNLPLTCAQPELLVIGASTGGPPLLCELLRALPRPFPLPIALAQHLMPGFALGFAGWLGQETKRQVTVVNRPLLLSAGQVYLADDERHLVVTGPGRVATQRTPEQQLYPSVDLLFESAAKSLGSRAIGLLLTGMGADGARGMEALAQARSLTIAQAPHTCVVDGMPGQAIERNAARLVLTPLEMPATIAHAVRGVRST